MRILSFLRSNLKFSLLLLILAVIPLILFLISYIDTKSQSPIKGYADLNEKIDSLSKDSTIAQDGQYLRMVEKFNDLGATNSYRQRFKDFQDAYQFLMGAYSYTNNPKLYPLAKDFLTFGQENFPKDFKKNDYPIFCLDPTCAENPQPKEILSIIDFLNSSDFPDYIKESTVNDIKNVGYLSDKDINSKVLSYLAIADNIKNDKHSSSSANLEIAKRLQDYVINKYPAKLKELGVKDGKF